MAEASETLRPAYLTKQEAADYARLHVRTLERAMHANEIRYSGGGGRKVRIRPEWVDDWLEHRGDGEAE